jgi:hypothetical protein
MSLSIDIQKIASVLLADGWHQVVLGSLELDGYDFMRQNAIVLTGAVTNGLPATGARWKEAGDVVVACPVTAILAVKLSAPTSVYEGSPAWAPAGACACSSARPCSRRRA